MPKSIEYMQDNNLSEKHAKCLNWEKLLRRHNSNGLINYLILLALDSMSSAPACAGSPVGFAKLGSN